MDLKESKKFRIIKKFFIINTILLLPCAYLTIFKLFNPDYSHQQEIWTFEFLGLILPVVLMRTLLLPYICTLTCGSGYFIYLLKSKFPKKELITFAICLIITILGLLSLEEAFAAAMGI